MNPYDLESDPQFRKFFKHLLTPEEIMKSDDIPCDNEHLEDVDSAVSYYSKDLGVVCEAIQESITQNDVDLLLTNPISFGLIMKDKVLAYIESVVEGEENEQD